MSMFLFYVYILYYDCTYYMTYNIYVTHSYYCYYFISYVYLCIQEASGTTAVWALGSRGEAQEPILGYLETKPIIRGPSQVTY